MAWKETHVMDERIKFIGEVLSKNYSIKEICNDYEISRKTGYKWIKRYKEEGVKGLIDKKRIPHRLANKIDRKTIEEIIKIKKKYLNWGPKKIREKLIEYNPEWERHPAVSTIGEYLKQEGLVVPRIRRNRAKSTIDKLTKGLNANEVWAVDFKGHFNTKDGKRCNPLTVSDDYSRYLLYCRHVNRMNYEEARREFEIIFREYGLPVVIRSDNGTPFSARNIFGLSRLSFWWIRLGIYPERIGAGKPYQNGRHERMHRTLKKETISPPADNIKKQNESFIRFQREYNEERPHESLNMKTPASYYCRADRSFPNRLRKAEYKNNIEKRKVQQGGVITRRGKDIFISEALIGEYLGLEQICEDLSILWYYDYKLGYINHKTGKIKPETVKAFKKETINYKMCFV